MLRAVAIICGIGILIGAVIGLYALEPDSHGAEISGRTAVIHPGGKLVLTTGSGKTRKLWSISRDGNQVFIEVSLESDKHPELCGVGCTITPKIGSWPSEKQLKITDMGKGYLKVTWPKGVGHN